MKTVYSHALGWSLLAGLLTGRSALAQTNLATAADALSVAASTAASAAAAQMAESNALQMASRVWLTNYESQTDGIAPPSAAGQMVLDLSSPASAAALERMASNAIQAAARIVLPNQARPRSDHGRAQDQTGGQTMLTESVAGCVPPSAGLVGWWEGEGNTSDSVGSNPGVPCNGPSFPSGMVGSAFQFDGSSKAVRIPYTQGMAATNFSFEAWINPPSVLNHQAFIVGQAFGRQLVVYPQAGALRVALWITAQGGGFQGVNSGRPIPIGEFIHLAGTYDGSRLSLYTNGVLAAQATLGIAIGDSGCAYHIGGVYSPSEGNCSYAGQFFDGLVDEVGYYSRALSAGEVGAIYTAGAAGKCKPVPACVSSPTSAAGWWPGDESTSDIVGAHHGTPLNSPTYGVGEVGKAFHFDGENQCVEIAHDSALVTANFSIEAWVEPLAQVNDEIEQEFIFGQAYGRQLVARPGVEGVRVALVLLDASGTPYEPESTCEIPIGQFTHLAGTWDGALLSLYTNGVLGSQAGLMVVAYDSGCPFYIGGVYSPAPGGCGYEGQFFQGLIDEVTCYNQSLSAEQIAGIYQAGFAGKCQPQLAPSITQQPASQIVNRGANVMFAVVATSTLSLGYQWTHDGAAIPGATASSFTKSNVQTSDAGAYAVEVTSLAGQMVRGRVTSGNALLAVVVPPADQTITYGGSATLSVATAGPSELGYQWRRNDSPIPGATSSVLAIARPRVADAGAYDVVVSVAFGQVTSAAATLTVNPRLLTITATSLGRARAAGIPSQFTGQITGLQPGDEDLEAEYDPIATSDPDIYNIVPRLHDPNGKAVNYTVNRVNGRLYLSDHTPTANGLEPSTFKNTPIDIELSGTDPRQLPLTYHVMSSNPTLRGGSWTLQGNMVHFTPAPDFEGRDGFVFVVDNHQTDNRYDGENISAPAIVVINVKPLCHSISFPADRPFESGTFLNVVSNTGLTQLELKPNGMERMRPYLNVPCSGRGTLARIDVNPNPGKEPIVGQYLTAPEGMGGYPSRVAVDGDGNVWVANYHERSDVPPGWVPPGSGNGPLAWWKMRLGSITKIGVLRAGIRGDKGEVPDEWGKYHVVTDGNGESTNPLKGEYVEDPEYCTFADRDDDGLYRTSYGWNNILPWSNEGGADSLGYEGGTNTAVDEAIMSYVRVLGTGAGTLAVDQGGNVWVGGGDRPHWHQQIRADGSWARGTEFCLGAGLWVPDQRDIALWELDGRWVPDKPGSFDAMRWDSAPAWVHGDYEWSFEDYWWWDGYWSWWDYMDYRNLGTHWPVIRIGAGGWGGLVDTNGILWSTGGDVGLMRYDPGPQKGQLIDTRWRGYGLAIDPHTQEIWHCLRGSGKVTKLSPDGTSIASYYHTRTGERAQGLVVDARGNVWVAHSKACGKTVGHLKTDGTLVGTVPLVPVNGAKVVGPTGLSVDTDGMVWVVNFDDCSAMRINPDLGALGTGGVPIGAVDQVINLGAKNSCGYHCETAGILNLPANPDAYGDMTGFLNVSLLQSGSWTVVHDANAAGVQWTSISWTEALASAPHLKVEARAAEQSEDLSNNAFQVVENGVDLTALTGRYVEIRVTFTRDYGVTDSPALTSLSVTWCDAPQYAPTIITEPADQHTCAEDTATFSVAAEGPSLSYKWFHNDNEMTGPGRNGPTLILDNLPAGYAGSYFVEISNPFGSVRSRVAQLTLDAPSTINVVKVEDAKRLGKPGSFAISRSCGVGPLTVGYSVGGSAHPDQHYERLSGTATFDNGKRITYVNVVPKPATSQEDSASVDVILSINWGYGYIQGPSPSATLQIAGNHAPKLTLVRELELPDNSGSYTISFRTLKENSEPDPLDEDLDPVVYIVEAVKSGSLMINGLPWSPANCTNDANSVAVWTAPTTVEELAKPAFLVHLFDGLAESDPPVEVHVSHKPKAYLYGWGQNNWGALGNGFLPDPVAGENPGRYYDYLDWQGENNLIKHDSRWQYYSKDAFGYAHGFETHPTRVLDLGDVNVVSFVSDNCLSSAVGSDGNLWQWGCDPSSFLFGIPKAWTSTGTSSRIWTWDEPLDGWSPGLPLQLYSPTPRIYTEPKPVNPSEPETRSFPLEDEAVKFVCGGLGWRLALKNDGQLLSWGSVSHGGVLGRRLLDGDEGDRYSAGSDPSSPWYTYGIAPRPIMIDANSDRQLEDAQFVEVHSGTYAAIAKCADGSWWWWGELYGWEGTGSDNYQDWVFVFPEGQVDLENPPAVPLWEPKRLDCLAPGDAPVTQMSVAANHYVFLRADGSVWELGYIPQEDVDGVPGRDFRMGPSGGFDACYKATPIAVDLTQLPANSHVSKVCAGGSFAALVTDTGQVWVWGRLSDDPNETGLRTVEFPSPIAKVATGYDCLFAIDIRGRLWGWGRNQYGILKQPEPRYSDAPFYDQPVRIPGLENVSDVFCADSYSVFAVATPEQGKVTNLVATATNLAVRLTWSSYPSASFYRIFRCVVGQPGDQENPDNYASLGTSVSTSYLDQNLTNGTTYYYVVCAVVNGADTAKSWEAGATPLAPPGPVSGLSAMSQCRVVSLTWQAPSSGAVQEYRIKRALKDLNNPNQPGEFNLHDMCPGNVTHYDDESAAPDSEYYYKVSAANAGGESQDSAPTPYPKGIGAGCAARPHIASSWKKNGWFVINRVPTGDPLAGADYQATLYWAPPLSAPPWSPEPTGFRIRTRYLYQGRPVFEGSHDVSFSQANKQVYLYDEEHNQTFTCYAFTWPTSGLECYARVSAIVNGQEGESSIEVGPLTVSGDSFQWEATLNAVPGYDQVYLDWPDNEHLCSYAVKCTTQDPEAEPTPDWVVLATGLTDARYWDNRLDFSLVDINADGINGLVAFLRTQGDVLREILWPRLSGVQAALNSYDTDTTDTSVQMAMCQALALAMATAIAQPFSAAEYAAIQNGGYTFSTRATGLFSRLTALTDIEKRILNRQLLQDAWGEHNYLHSWDGERFYMVEATICGDTAIASTGWVAAQPSSDELKAPDFALSLAAHASAYRGMVNIDWHFLKWFPDVSAEQGLNLGITNPTIIAVTRCDAQGVVIQIGVQDSDYSVDAANGKVMILPGSNLICAQPPEPAERVCVTFAPSLAEAGWQFALERTNGASGQYVQITETGFGLAYMDQEVVSGQSYTYRVTAFDQHYNRYAAETGEVVPTYSDTMVVAPRPGNGFVDLSWTPVRAASFEIMRSLNNLDWESLARLVSQNAYQNAPNSYRDATARNCVTNYYYVHATTPTGLTFDSPITNAVPLPTLSPLPPDGFHAELVAGPAGPQVILTWRPRSGVARYQVFVRDHTRLRPLYPAGTEGIRGTSCVYNVPAGTADSTVMSFAIRSVSETGANTVLTSDLAETSIAYADPGTATEGVVDLKVAGLFDNNLSMTGPTNVTLAVDTSLPNVQKVTFYVNDDVLQVVETEPYQTTWFHVPATPSGPHVLRATVEVVEGVRGVNATTATYSSSEVELSVTLKPELAAYRTSATDLQLPAPGLPIVLSRSYDSRDTGSGDGFLGTGWRASWLMSSLKLYGNLAEDWKGTYAGEILGVPQYYIGESSAHYVIITLPAGQCLQFNPQLVYYHGDPPDYYNEDVASVDIAFEGFWAGQGTLTPVKPCKDLAVTWDGETAGTYDVTMDCGQNGATPTSFEYRALDGTRFQFERDDSSIEGDGPFTYRLSRITDPNENSLPYSYGPTDAEDPEYDSARAGKVIAITHSCSRMVTFDYETADSITTTKVFDTAESLAPDPTPVLLYIVDDEQLKEVKKLVNRAEQDPAKPYETTTYEYGSNSDDTGRLVAVFDPRGVRIVANTYMSATDPKTAGCLATQTDVLNVTTTYTLAPDTGELKVTRGVGSESKTLEVIHDASGAIAAVTEPKEGGSPPDKPTITCTYDDRGRLVSQTDTNGNSRTYEYDDKDRLVAQSDELENRTSYVLDENGFPTSVTDARGNTTDSSYDESGNPMSTTDAVGAKTLYEYHLSARYDALSLPSMLKKESRSGRGIPFTIVTEYEYETADTRVIGDLKRTTEKWVDGKGDLAPNSKPISVCYEYDLNGNRTAEIKSRTCADGSVQYIRTLSTYDAQNRVIRTVVQTGTTLAGPWTDVPNTATQIEYENGKQALSLDGYDRPTTSLYDFAGRLIETEDADGTVTRTAYDRDGRPNMTEDRVKLGAGATTEAPGVRNTYDASGRVIKVERLDKVTFTLENAIGAPSPGPGVDYVSRGVEDDPPQFKMTASASGTVVSTNRTEYDALGRVKYSMDARFIVTEYGYDAAGRRTSVTVHKTPLSMDATSLLPPCVTAGTCAGDPKCAVTTYGYDANGNQVWARDALDHQTDYVYDEGNRQTRVIFPSAEESESRPTRTTVYDVLGRRVQTIDEEGVSTYNQYDFRGLLTSVTLGGGTPEQAVTSYEYDELGNLIKQTDAEAKTAAGVARSTTFEYDALGRRTARVLPGGLRETVAYGAAPDRYDPESRVRTETHTDFNGRSIGLTFDCMDRLDTKQLPAVAHWEGLAEVTDVPATTVGYAYNASGQSVWVARTVHAGGGDQTRIGRYGYDRLGRLRVKATINEAGATEGTLSYQYNADGSISSISARTDYNWPLPQVAGFYTNYCWDCPNPWTVAATRPSSAEWNYRYDAFGRLEKVNPDQSGSGADAVYAYDSVGALSETRHRNGLVTTYAYNERNWLRRVQARMADSLVANFDYDSAGSGEEPATCTSGACGLSPTGQRQAVEELLNGTGRTVSYQYDSLRRLVRETVSGTPAAFTARYDGFPAGGGILGYDRVGNRRARQIADASEGTIASLSAAGLTAYSGHAFDERDLLNPGNGFTYDLNGNTTAEAGGPTYTYDAENRLVKRSGGGLSTIEIVYDDAGNRVKKTVTPVGSGPVITKYLVEDRNPTGYAQVMEERDGSDATTVSYSYGLALISRNRGGTVHYYGYDGLGSVRFLADDNGNGSGAVTDTYTYDAFGILIEQTAPGGQTENNYRYTGQQWDSDLGMYYLRARYYRPELGRFWTMDSYEGNEEDPLSLHKYLYCHDDAVNGLDPSGRMNLSSFTATMAAWGSMMTVMIHRAGPTLNRVTVFAFEATTGNTVFLGGGGAAVVLKQGTRMGGVGWATWQWIGNLLKGGDKKVGTYRELSKVLKGTGLQAHHLNQDRAFVVIPKEEGVCVALGGSTNTQGGQHRRFHEVVEAFWDSCRSAGRKSVTNAEYNKVARQGLEESGLPQEEVNAFLRLMEESQRFFKYHDGPGGLQPVVPKPIPNI